MNLENDILIISLFDVFEIEGYIKITDEISSSPEYESIFGIIVDCRALDGIQLSIKDLKFIAAIGKLFIKYNKNLEKFVYVVNGNEMKKLVHSYVINFAHTKWKRPIFKSVDEAKTWIRSNN